MKSTFFFRIKDRVNLNVIGPAALCKAGKTAVVPKLVKNMAQCLLLVVGMDQWTSCLARLVRNSSKVLVSVMSRGSSFQS